MSTPNCGWEGMADKAISSSSYNLTNSYIFLNIRSLRAHYSHLIDLLKSSNSFPKAIILQEVWAPHDSQNTLDGYHKLELATRTGGKNAGGGVGIYIHNDLSYTRIMTEFKENLRDPFCSHS